MIIQPKESHIFKVLFNVKCHRQHGHHGPRLSAKTHHSPPVLIIINNNLTISDDDSSFELRKPYWSVAFLYSLLPCFHVFIHLGLWLNLMDSYGLSCMENWNTMDAQCLSIWYWAPRKSWLGRPWVLLSLKHTQTLTTHFTWDVSTWYITLESNRLKVSTNASTNAFYDY